MGNKSWHAALSCTLAIAMTALAIAGCSNGKNEKEAASNVPTASNASNAPAEEKPFKLSIVTNFDGVEFPQSGNEVQKAIEKGTNTELEIQVLPGSTIGEKLPAMIASGELPMAFAITNSQLRLPYMVNAFQTGAIWELGPYLQDYPNLSQIDPVIYSNTSVDGKIYGLPRVRSMARGAFLYRQDWLDNLGMKAPESIDDFYAMLKAFTLDDPDKNGKQDTYGMVATAANAKAFTVYFGAPNEWEEKDGQFTAAVTTDAYFEGIKFFKKLYDEKLINQDFALADRTKYEEEFSTGKAGVEVDTITVGVKMEERIKKLNPEGVVGMISVLGGPLGKRLGTSNGTNGIISFPKDTVKSEAELKRILAFFDTLAGKEMSTLLRWGIEGKHYNLVNGKAEAIEAASTNYINEVNSPYTLTLATQLPEVNSIDGEMSRLKRMEIEMPMESIQYAVHNPVINLISETASQKGGQLNKQIDDAIVKYVMGNINEDGWKAAVQHWRESGGDKIAQEYAEKFAKIQASN